MEEITLLEKLNSFTRRTHTLDEVYIFSVILCDNEVDRDFEKFSLNALKSLKELFIGKTGIFEHNTKENTQTARIFETELITDENRLTADNEPYTCLKANAYMIRTSKNEDLIKEIDGGIKKEISVSCSAGRKMCSVCGADISKKPCSHKKSKSYNGKLCFIILDDISDAYEWSFVSVPAQVNAGVTKRFGNQKENVRNEFLSGISDGIQLLEKDVADLSCYKL